MRSPSCSAAARLTTSRSAPDAAPPAAATASVTRADGGSEYTPGAATAPVTYTTTAVGVLVDVGAGVGAAAPETSVVVLARVANGNESSARLREPWRSQVPPTTTAITARPVATSRPTPNHTTHSRARST